VRQYILDVNVVACLRQNGGHGYQTFIQ